MFKRWSDRLLAFAPERHRAWLRRLLGVGAVAFIVFELSRFLVVIPMLAPAWDGVREQYAVMTGSSPLAMITGLTVTAIVFVVPMAGVVWLLRRLHRRLFHSGTVR